jgi:hypothetical protein
MSRVDLDTFVAEQIGPPRRRYWIARDPDPADGPPNSVRGWAFIYDELGPDGQWTPGWDTWEESFCEILRYPPEYATEPLLWRRESTGDAVDLTSLKSRYDGREGSS